ncbi:hypothetical protein ARMSODRAFT_971873 [Armillaria solidipes]|uniref:Uncharacterized protein n=1 Tax=Armillaria solidipes TaxID=1076256 RepID=A0A2H3C9G8_9AGAR|nr:hypothetical protein ARMSODRAFT_971873 [Armillaria solidipes]
MVLSPISERYMRQPSGADQSKVPLSCLYPSASLLSTLGSWRLATLTTLYFSGATEKVLVEDLAGEELWTVENLKVLVYNTQNAKYEDWWAKDRAPALVKSSVIKLPIASPWHGCGRTSCTQTLDGCNRSVSDWFDLVHGHHDSPSGGFVSAFSQKVIDGGTEFPASNFRLPNAHARSVLSWELKPVPRFRAEKCYSPPFAVGVYPKREESLPEGHF